VAAVLAAAAAVASTAAAAAVLNVNAGGVALSGALPDSSPSALAVGGARYVSTTPVNGTDAPELFQSHHWGPAFAYGVPVAAGTYQVHFHFAEVFGPNFRDGARVFDVSAGDAPDAMAVVIPGLDVHAVAGAATALTVSRTVAVATSTLLLQFEASANNAMVSGLTITTDDGAFGAEGGAPVVTATPAPTEAPAAETPVPTPVARPQGGIDGGVVSTPAPVTPEYTGTVGVQPGQLSNPDDPDDGAHAVPGGPYVAVDVDGSGTATMVLDGSGSHTHFAPPEGTPKSVVAFTWSVFETGRILGVTSKLTATFPTGMTRLLLTVKDWNGDVHADVTNVTVTDGVTGGLICYYHAGVEALPPVGQAPAVKPAYAAVVDDVSFAKLSDFGGFAFAADAWLGRCIGSYTAGAAGTVTFGVHATAGTARVAVAGKAVGAAGVFVPEGTHAFEVVFAKAAGPTAALTVDAPASALTHKAGDVVPVITSMSSTGGPTSGAARVILRGVGFLRGEEVTVGGVVATILADTAGKTTDDEITFVTPPAAADGPAPVTVTTAAGTSNALTYTYSSGAAADASPVYVEEVLRDADGNEYKLNGGGSIALGPDGKIYIGNVGQGRVHKLSVDFQTHTVVDACATEIGGQILGVSFNPTDTAAEPTLLVSIGDLKGGRWDSGRVVKLKSLATGGCFGRPEDLVTGLPVQIGHDHAIGRPAFMQNGDMLLPVGGMTNAGTKHPSSGDVAESPLSGAVVKVALSKGAAFDGKITYSTNNPETAQQTGGDVSVWAAGVRNGLTVERHSSGTFWIVDNGANAGFGDISVSCTETVGFKGNGDIHDRLLKLEEGGYYGHPNPNRGATDARQCVYRKPNVVAPGFTPAEHLFDASTNGKFRYDSLGAGGGGACGWPVRDTGRWAWRATQTTTDTRLIFIVLVALPSLPGVLVCFPLFLPLFLYRINRACDVSEQPLQRRIEGQLALLQVCVGLQRNGAHGARVDRRKAR